MPNPGHRKRTGTGERTQPSPIGMAPEKNWRPSSIGREQITPLSLKRNKEARLAKAKNCISEEGRQLDTDFPPKRRRANQ